MRITLERKGNMAATGTVAPSTPSFLKSSLRVLTNDTSSETDSRRQRRVRSGLPVYPSVEEHNE